MKDNGFDKVIDDLMDDNDFVHNPRVRRQKLEEFRKVDPETANLTTIFETR